MVRRFLLIIIGMLLSAGPGAAQAEQTVTLVTHDSFAVSEEVLAQFEAETGITVQLLRAGDVGVMVTQAVLTRDNPLGDVLYGIDNTFLSRALDNNIFEPYESSLLTDIDDVFKIDPQNRVVPVDYSDVCLNYDISYFEMTGIPLPQSLKDLTQPQYRGLLVAQNPATSSPGLAFLLATIGVFGETGDYTYLDFWSDLISNETLIVDDWTTAYFGYFTQGAEDGTYPLVVSYASSPPFTVDPETGEPKTASITADGTCFRQIEFAGILKGTRNRTAAEKLIDFLLSVPFQEDMPLLMYVFPVNTNAELPDVFADYADIAELPVVIESDEIEEKREEWIQAWTETVLR